MFVLAIWIALVGLGIYRTLVLALPFFHEALSLAPLLNVACGSLSDLSSGLILTFLWLLAARVMGEKQRLILGRVALIVTCVFVYSLAAHIRYVEHFGMNARPYHTATMAHGEIWIVGTMMVLTSARAWVIIIPMLGMLALLRGPAARAEARWVARSNGGASKALALVFTFGVMANSAVNLLRNRPGMHNELRYSVYVALYYNYEAFKNVKATPVPTFEELAHLRTLVAGPRAYAPGQRGKQYPLWQTRISAPPAADSKTEAVRQDLKQFIARTTRDEGPWNVVIVLSESLRANEIEAMGPVPEAFRELTPHFSAMAEDGVRFTSAMSSGIRTHFGQTASQCSLFGAKDFSILQDVPMANATCLGDVFRKKGYDTFFFYGADNHFDNQDVFYQKHGIRHVQDENDMAKGGPKGGWGYSDAYLFQHVRTQLEQASKPFFAVVLSLTNHPPLKIPDDVPPGLVKDALHPRGKMLQYVDWSVGEFYRSMKRLYPRTLFVFIADHGQFWGDEGYFNQIPTWEQMRWIARIPLFIIPVHPDAPASVKGQVVPTLASNIDIPPTVLSLLGWEDVPQQFMGMDAFSRTGAIYIDWINKLVRITPEPGGGATLYRMDERTEDLIGTTGRYNLLAPVD